MPPLLIGGGIKRCLCLKSVCLSVCLTSNDVCRVHRKYSWRPQLLEARRAGRRRPGVRRVCAGAGPQRVARTGAGSYRGGLPPTACWDYCRDGRALLHGHECGKLQDVADVETANFRPVSNLTFRSKVVERVVARQLNDYLTAPNLPPRCQSAYRRHHSTETAMVRVAEKTAKK